MVQKRSVSEIRRFDDPQPSFCLLRAVKRGPFVPARIYWTLSEPGVPENVLDRGGKPFLAAEIAGRTVDPLDLWQRVWEMEIDEAEYNFRMAEMEWMKKHHPTDPLANPYKPVRLSAVVLTK